MIRSDSGWWSSRRLYGCLLLAKDVSNRRGRSPLPTLGGSAVRSLHNRAFTHLSIELLKGGALNQHVLVMTMHGLVQVARAVN